VHLGEGNDSEFFFLFKFICEIVRPSFCAHLSTPKISERDSPFLVFSALLECFVLSCPYWRRGVLSLLRVHLRSGETTRLLLILVFVPIDMCGKLCVLPYVCT